MDDRSCGYVDCEKQLDNNRLALAAKCIEKGKIAEEIEKLFSQRNKLGSATALDLIVRCTNQRTVHLSMENKDMPLFKPVRDSVYNALEDRINKLCDELEGRRKYE